MQDLIQRCRTPPAGSYASYKDASCKDAGRLLQGRTQMQDLIQRCRTHPTGSYASYKDASCKDAGRLLQGNTKMQDLIQKCRTPPAGSYASYKDAGTHTKMRTPPARSYTDAGPYTKMQDASNRVICLIQRCRTSYKDISSYKDAGPLCFPGAPVDVADCKDAGDLALQVL